MKLSASYLEAVDRSFLSDDVLLSLRMKHVVVGVGGGKGDLHENFIQGVLGQLDHAPVGVDLGVNRLLWQRLFCKGK